jgi:folate-binding protein YgfZ
VNADPAERAVAVRRGVGLFRLDDRALLAVRGADRVRWLDGMLTQDIAHLAAGADRSGCYALLLTPQGGILADFHVLHRGEELWLETAAAHASEIRARLLRYVVADDVTLADRSVDFARLGLEGARAEALLARVLGRAPGLAPDCGNEFECEGRRLFAAAFGWSGTRGYQLFAPADGVERLVAALHRHALPGELVLGDAGVLEILRIEACIPRLHRELHERVLPPETGLMARAVSLSKGCYTGQEIVARLVSRGAERHRLVALRFASGPPGAGSEICTEGRRIGEVTSSCRSALAGPIGLGFVRKPWDAVGSALDVGGVAAQVVAAPFVGTHEAA